MTRRLQLLFLFVFMLGSMPAFSQRVVGYLPSYRDPNSSTIRWSCLTDVCFSFINFRTDGTLITDTPGDAVFGFDAARFTTTKGYCKPISATGPKLWISVGGADPGGQRKARFTTVCSNAGTRTVLVNALVAFAQTHNLAGIDIDWEFPSPNATDRGYHQALMEELKARIISQGLSGTVKLSMAVGGETNFALSNPNHISYCNAAAMTACDYIHCMTYDLPASYGANHSDVTRSQESVIGWKNHGGAGAPWSKMMIGIPLYGRPSPRGADLTQNYSADGDYQNVYNGANGLSSSGYYYNSKSQIDSKVDWIMAQGGNGVILWDIGQDRAAPYNLQDATCARMATACSAPQPNLGADKGVCNPGSVVLASGVGTQSGRTFSWTRNGATIGGASSPDYTASQAGTYVVSVTQGSCSRTDEVVVVATDAVIVPPNDRCGSGVVPLTVTSTGSTYEWYDAATSGTLVHTGQSYSPNLTATTTYYVQQATGSATYYSGKPSINAPSAQSEFAAAGTIPAYANRMVVSQSLKIQSVTIYLGAAGYTATPAYANARLMAISAVDGLAIAYQSAAVNIPASPPSTPFVFPANLDLPPGTYYIGLYVPGTAATSAVWLDPGGVTPLYSQAGVYTVDGRAYQNYGGGFALAGSQGTKYGQLFNWVITTGVTNPCPRTSVTATINPSVTPSVSIAANPGTTICTGTSVTFTATPTNGGTTPVYQWKLNGANVGTNSATYTNAGLTNGQTVSVTMTSNAACPSPATANSNVLTMTVTGALTPSVSIAANPGTTICSGTSVTFTATPTNGGT
ncbi:MAG: C-terminal target protein, partial [Cytophagaceae bacterium]|nr:C-terminal target protein [Cytophagaceae bacterium]